MSADPVAAYRIQLRAAAERLVRVRERRRRTGILVSIVISALFLVSGAVAAAQQAHWLGTIPGSLQINMRWGGHQGDNTSDGITTVCVRPAYEKRGTKVPVTGSALRAAPCTTIMVTGVGR